MKIDVNNTGEKSIWFEDIDLLALPFVVFYLLRGFRVYCFSMTNTLEKWGITKNLASRKKIIKITYLDEDRSQQFNLNNIILDEIESVYRANFLHNTAIENLDALVESAASETIFKKSMIYQLFDYYRMNVYLDQFFSRSSKSVKLLFVPGKMCYNLKNLTGLSKSIEEKKYIKIPLLGRIYGIISAIFLRLESGLLLIGLPFWIALKIGMPDGKVGTKKNFNAGIRLSSSEWALSNKYRRFDFLLDNVRINKTNTLFCIEEPVSPELMKTIITNGYSYVEIRNILKNADIAFYKSIFLKSFIPLWLTCTKNILKDPPFFVRLYAESLFRYLLWTRFDQCYSIKHYISYNEQLPSDIIRNIIFENNNIQTWLYAHSIATYDFFSLKNQPDIRDKLFTYFYYEHYVVWGEKMEQYYRSHPNNIRQFHKLGCLWSEHVKTIRDTGRDNDTLKAFQQKFLKNTGYNPEKIIGVFDVSTGDDAPLIDKDMIAFIDGILQVLEDRPAFGVIFKNKWSFKKIALRSPTLVDSYEKVKNHPRCYLTDELDSDPSETIAAADLVISAPFTSPTIESLGAKRKAIYFDATGKFRGTYYDQIPRFVVHDRNELIKTIDYWLNSMSDEEFIALLNRYILQEIDEYLDGAAITRFRQLIST